MVEVLKHLLGTPTNYYNQSHKSVIEFKIQTSEQVKVNVTVTKINAHFHILATKQVSEKQKIIPNLNIQKFAGLMLLRCGGARHTSTHRCAVGAN